MGKARVRTGHAAVHFFFKTSWLAGRRAGPKQDDVLVRMLLEYGASGKSAGMSTLDAVPE